MMMPIVRGRERTVYIENRRQPRSKLVERLHIIIRRPNTRVSMIEVDVRCDECATAFQQGSYFGELLRLNLTDILKNALRYNYVKPLIAKADRSFHEIGLYKIRCWRVNRYVNPVILYVCSKHSPQSRGPAANIKKITLPVACNSIYKSGNFFQSEMRLRILKILLSPKVSFMICLAHLSH